MVSAWCSGEDACFLAFGRAAASSAELASEAACERVSMRSSQSVFPSPHPDGALLAYAPARGIARTLVIQPRLILLDEPLWRA